MIQTFCSYRNKKAIFLPLIKSSLTNLLLSYKQNLKVMIWQKKLEKKQQHAKPKKIYSQKNIKSLFCIFSDYINLYTMVRYYHTRY